MSQRCDYVRGVAGDLFHVAALKPAVERQVPQAVTPLQISALRPLPGLPGTIQEPFRELPINWCAFPFCPNIPQMILSCPLRFFPYFGRNRNGFGKFEDGPILERRMKSAADFESLYYSELVISSSFQYLLLKHSLILIGLIELQLACINYSNFTNYSQVQIISYENDFCEFIYIKNIKFKNIKYACGV